MMWQNEMSVVNAPFPTTRQWSERLLLWLVCVLFAFQVAVHASMPADGSASDMNMADWLTAGPTGAVAPGHPEHTGTMPSMHSPAPVTDAPASNPAMPTHSGPAGSGHTQHAKGLCCMPPVALVPALWTLPPLPLSRQSLTPPKTVHEALRLLRATARGPPLGHLAGVQAV